MRDIIIHHQLLEILSLFHHLFTSYLISLFFVWLLCIWFFASSFLFFCYSPISSPFTPPPPLSHPFQRESLLFAAHSWILPPWQLSKVQLMEKIWICSSFVLILFILSVVKFIVNILKNYSLQQLYFINLTVTNPLWSQCILFNCWVSKGSVKKKILHTGGTESLHRCG